MDNRLNHISPQIVKTPSFRDREKKDIKNELPNNYKAKVKVIYKHNIRSNKYIFEDEVGRIIYAYVLFFELDNYAKYKGKPLLSFDEEYIIKQEKGLSPYLLNIKEEPLYVIAPLKIFESIKDLLKYLINDEL